MTRVGCCGFTVSRQVYFETFRVVELQQPFYQPPKVPTARASGTPKRQRILSIRSRLGN